MAREFTVFPVLNGWVVHIGCTFIAYTDKAVAEKDFSEFLADPGKKEKEMLARYAPEKIFPEIQGGGGGMAKTAEAPYKDPREHGGGIERALRR